MVNGNPQRKKVKQPIKAHHDWCLSIIGNWSFKQVNNVSTIPTLDPAPRVKSIMKNKIDHKLGKKVNCAKAWGYAINANPTPEQRNQLIN